MAIYLDPIGFIIVVGGSLLALLLQFRLAGLLRLAPLVLRGLLQPASTPAPLRERLLALAEIARRGGPLALEEEAARESDPFLASGLRALVEGARPDELRPLLGAELQRQAASLEEPALFIEAGANLAPALGMVGTLLALIGGRGIGPALLPTLYGTLLGPVVLQSLGGALRQKGEQQLRLWSAAGEGLLGISAGDAPRHLAERLQALLPGGASRRDEGDEVA
ncbi:MAG TPA: MotA/TolQ/ExbB proton channel family protein [Symbiobacteriaceae bacterium]|nr:MotA/TolQ/ExbB proton channel family protein [Symbiobacteriaceae bacterium]